MGFKLCILADDFTGAGDSAVQFRQSGYSAFLGLSDWDSGIDLSSYDVLVVSTESRFQTGEKAYRTVKEAVATCRGQDVDRYFKKIDSTIRGNIADEIAAMMDTLGYDCAIVAPAAPKNGRTVESGHCLINGIPVGSSVNGHDPFTPVRDSFVPHLFTERFPGQVESIDHTVIEQGSEIFRESLEKARENGARIIVPDARTIEDLRTIASVSHDDSILFCGASGLAEAMTHSRPVDQNIRLELNLLPGELIFVIGSVSSISRDQFAHLNNYQPVGVLSPDVAGLLDDESAELDRLLSLASEIPSDRPIVIITSGNLRGDQDIVAESHRHGLSEKDLGGVISSFLGKVAARIFSLRTVGAMFVTGGDTAARVAESFGIKGIDILQEILPGIPLSQFKTDLSDEPVYLITKAGGFGTADALQRILEFIAAEGHREGAVS